MVVHRDLRLCNFFVTDGMQIKIGDFGNACIQRHMFEMLMEDIGFPTHKAPELSSCVDTLMGYDGKVDCWSLGICMF